MERHVGTFESKGSEYRIEGQWYKANEVDEDKAKDMVRIEKLEKENETMRNGDITHFTEWHIQKDRIQELKKKNETLKVKLSAQGKLIKELYKKLDGKE